MRQPQELAFYTAIAAQKVETIRSTAREWRLRGMNGDGLVPIEVIAVETKSEEILSKLKEVFNLVEEIRKRSGVPFYELSDD